MIVWQYKFVEIIEKLLKADFARFTGSRGNCPSIWGEKGRAEKREKMVKLFIKWLYRRPLYIDWLVLE